MKWRSIIVLAFVIFSLATPSFLSPKTVSAALTNQDLQTTQNRCVSINTSGADDPNAFVTACKMLVGARFEMYKSDQTASEAMLTAVSFTDYQNLLRYLKGETSSLPGNVANVIPSLLLNALRGESNENYSVQIVSVDQIIKNAQDRMLVTGGELTPEEQERRRLENAQNAAAATAGLATKPACKGTEPATWFTICLDEGFSWLIKNTFLKIAGWFLWLSSELLNYIIKIGIVGFKNWAPDGLYPIWQIVRQVVSMFVVFSGLYIGFMYIIGRQSAFQRYFVWIAIFGIFVNFSYPITRAAIDLSNIVSVSIYSSALGTTDIANSRVSAGDLMMSRFGLGQLVGVATSEVPATASSANVNIYKDINTTPGALLVLVYVIYAAYIFFIAAGILMMRTLALSFIIISSPLLLVDSVIPKLGDFAQKLREIFFQQLSVSIVFMIMLYIALRMTEVFASGFSTEVGPIAQIFNTLMMLIVLHIMLKVTKATSGAIGQMASEYVGKVGGFATGAAIGVATGGAGLLARSTVGAAAARWAESDSLKNQQNTWAGRRKLDLATSLAGSSYDLRKSDKFANIAGTMGGAGMTKGLGITGRLKSYDEAKKDYTAEVARRAGSMTDEQARNDYIQSQRGGVASTLQGLALGKIGADGPQGKKTDAELATEGLVNTIKKEEEDKFKKYASASPDVKETMKNQEVSAEHAKRFADIDTFLDPNTSDQERDAIYRAQGAEIQKTLRDQRVAMLSKANNQAIAFVKTYFETDQSGRGALGEGATEKEQAIIASIEKYKTAPTDEDKATALKEIGNDSIAKAIINSDDINTAAKRRVQAAYLEAVGQQAQAVKEMASGVDVNEMLQKVVKGNVADKLVGEFKSSGGPSSPLPTASSPKNPPTPPAGGAQATPATPPTPPAPANAQERATA